MTLRVATVLSAREWEPGLVAAAREGAAIRLVLRAYEPDEIRDRADGIDVIVAGGETTWVTPAQIASWQRNNIRVVGIYPAGDRPARRMFQSAGADEVLPDDTSTESLIQAIRFLAPAAPATDAASTGQIVAVTGPRGAPGRTEVALALAWNWSKKHRTLLVDADIEAPALAVRLGIPPRPDLTDAADAVRARGRIDPATTHSSGSFIVIVGSDRPGESPLRTEMAEDVVEAAAASAEVVVLDLGTAGPESPLLKRSDHAVLVVDASAVGLVRAARFIERWAGPPPALIVNRVGRGQEKEIAAAARRWTGLEPAVLLPARDRFRKAAGSARRPDRALRRSLRRLAVPA
jgi:MinD-like ATPase involved in chromosome partitioning or flagellar assembly